MPRPEDDLTRAQYDIVVAGRRALAAIMREHCPDDSEARALAAVAAMGLVADLLSHPSTGPKLINQVNEQLIGTASPWRVTRAKGH